MIKRDEYLPPADAIEALARCLYPAIIAYFESEEGQREFAEWQAEQGVEISPDEGVKRDEAAGRVA